MKFLKYTAVLRINGEEFETLVFAKNAREATIIAIAKYGKLFIKLR